MGSFVRLATFLDQRVVRLLAFCVFLSCTIYVAETSFAYAILLYLIELGLTDAAIPSAFRIFEDMGAVNSIWLLIGVTLFRGVNWWFLQYSTGAVLETFRYIQRQRITNALMEGRISSTSQSIALYGEKTNEASAMLVAAQTTLVHGILGIAYFLTLCYLSWQTTLFCSALLGLIYIPVWLLNRTVRSSGEAINREWTQINEQLLLAFNNIFFLNISGMISKTKKDADHSLGQFLSHFLFYHRISAVVLVLPQIAGIIILVVVSYYSSQFGFLGKSMLVPYFYLFLRFIQVSSLSATRFSEVSFKWPQIVELYSWWKKDQEERITSSANIVEKSVNFVGPLAFRMRDMGFSYADGKAVFKNFSIQVPRGELAVITGRSGMGKSTLLNLLLGELNAQTGKVEVSDGESWHSTAEVRSTLWKNIGYVGADSYMIAGSIRENLTFGLEYEPSPSELKIRLEQADCQFVWELKDTLDYPLGEGGKGLSTGQKQRLGLARALLRKPKALILDEFTANLDQKSQQHLMDTLKRLKGNVTIVVVTHQKELLGIADLTIDLENRLSLAAI